jgi:hypothetical protein
VESTIKQINAFFAESGKRPQVGQPAIEWQLVHFEIAGVQHCSSFGAHHDRKGIGNGVVDRHKFQSKGPKRFSLPAFANSKGEGAMRCSLSFASIKGKRQRGANQRNVIAQLQQVGHRPMWSS